MSFMFHPYPYSDPQAVNDVSGQGVSPVRGLHAVARSISALLREGKRVGLDVYPGADYLSLVNVVRNLCAEEAVDFIDASGLLKSPEDIDALLLPYLPEDRTADPGLLYGRRYPAGYTGLQQESAVEGLQARLKESRAALVFGPGSLAPALQGRYDVRVWMDITPPHRRAGLQERPCPQHRRRQESPLQPDHAPQLLCGFRDRRTASLGSDPPGQPGRLHHRGCAGGHAAALLCRAEGPLCGNLHNPLPLPPGVPGGRLGRVLHSPAAPSAPGNAQLCLGLRPDSHGGVHRRPVGRA